ncbi:telethonin [Tachysurus fulvidraco]|uniref:telethonin n=1 Tax=Tachysurus fulvidraco TaxID=1234273 RepID=UPI000F4E4030|nr:telethonin [Tachysurus fulvidraco]XP_047664830.1 telethonin [Tachysurus fulvidraco]
MHCLSRTPSSYLVNTYSDVKEVDESKRESYEATWLDLVMETRPEYKNTLTEKDSSRKESYKRKRVRHFVVRRFLNQTFCTGEEGTKLREYQLPFKTTLPLQIFVPRKLCTSPETNRETSPSFLRSDRDSEKSESRKKVLWSGVEDATQPERTKFTVRTLVSPAWDLARDFQRT